MFNDDQYMICSCAAQSMHNAKDMNQTAKFVMINSFFF